VVEPFTATGPTEGSKVMDVAFVDDHLSVTGWPAWAEAGEALRATLGDAGGAVCASAIGILPLAISASATKQNKTALRSEWKRIVSTPCVTEHYMELDARNVPPDWSQDCGIARRCKLFLGTELGRGALVQEDPFVWAPMERRREFAAANLQAESYLEREHNAMGCACRRARHKRHYGGQCIDITFAPQHSCARPALSLQ